MTSPGQLARPHRAGASSTRHLPLRGGLGQWDNRVSRSSISAVIFSGVGYEDVAFFRDLFKRHTHLSPSHYREKFGRSTAVAA
jgi:AraC-like DNA-binding protein